MTHTNNPLPQVNRERLHFCEDSMANNYLGLDGIDFIEFASADSESLRKLFLAFGFSRLKETVDGQVDYYSQNDIHVLVSKRKQGFASEFVKAHGPCVSSMGWRVKDATLALRTALERGAEPAATSEYVGKDGQPIPAIKGIGDSLIYFIDKYSRPGDIGLGGFKDATHPDKTPGLGFTVIDHLTNNVFKGTMERWANFYKNVFGFEEVRYFDIKGVKTGLTSYALRSPCGKFCIPINEGKESKSQIDEYLREYNGPGVQHIAFLTDKIIDSVSGIAKAGIQTLDIDDEYYSEVFNRVPNVSEDKQRIQELGILVDGDDEGYLLQIFTKNIVGPIFIEIIQRRNHHAFGEGNFGALFRSIERDQEKRGVL
jgi:4-hydroxyphenylpyruvate dioxygenase